MSRLSHYRELLERLPTSLVRLRQGRATTWRGGYRVAKEGGTQSSIAAYLREGGAAGAEGADPRAGAGVEMLLQRHSLFLLLGPAVKKDDRELLQAIESRLTWLFEPSLEYVRTGREVPELDFIGLDDRAALDVARSWNVSVAERRRLISAARASDSLRGLAWRAAGQWFAARMAQGR